MSNYPGRIITKDPFVISTTQASGMWTLQQSLQAIQSGIWPGIGSTVTQSFTASGYWTAPAGVTQVDYLVVAAGGGGGQGVSGSANGGGGGAGGFRTGSGYPVTAGNTYTITIGAGGNGGTAYNPAASPSGAGSGTSGNRPSRRSACERTRDAVRNTRARSCRA